MELVKNKPSIDNEYMLFVKNKIKLYFKKRKSKKKLYKKQQKTILKK